MTAARIRRARVIAATNSSSVRVGDAIDRWSCSSPPKARSGDLDAVFWGGRQAFDRGGDAVAELLPGHGAARGDPIHLQHPARTGEGLVAMPGVVGPPEHQQRAKV